MRGPEVVEVRTLPAWGAFDETGLLLARIVERTADIQALETALNAELAAICADICAADRAGVDRERIVRAATPQLSTAEVLRCLDEGICPRTRP
jgi:hypothetical protein